MSEVLHLLSSFISKHNRAELNIDMKEIPYRHYGKIKEVNKDLFFCDNMNSDLAIFMKLIWDKIIKTQKKIQNQH